MKEEFRGQKEGSVRQENPEKKEKKTGLWGVGAISTGKQPWTQ